MLLLFSMLKEAVTFQISHPLLAYHSPVVSTAS